MKRILSIVLTAAMLLSMFAVAASAQTDHSVVADTTANNAFSYATDKDTYAPGETVTVTVSADSFWGDPDMVFEDDLDGITMGCYGVVSFTVSPVFSTETFTVAAVPKLVSSSTIVNWDYRSATMPSKNFMNTNGYGPVMVTLTSMTNDDGDAYLNFYGSGEIYTVTFTINEDVTSGEYPIYFGNYMKGDGKNDNDFYIDGIGPLDYNPIVDAYGQEIDASYNDFGDPLMIKVEATVSEEDLAAAAAVDTLIDAIGTVVYGENTVTYTTDESYTHIDAINYNNYYMHVGSVPFNTGSGYVEMEFYAEDAYNENGFGYIGGCTDASGGNPKIFYNPGTKTFMIASTDNWMNVGNVDTIYAESDVIECKDGEFIKAKFVYDGSNYSVLVNDEVVCAAEVSTAYNYFIFYPSNCKFYLKSMTVSDGNVTVSASTFADLQNTIGTNAGMTEKQFSFLGDSRIAIETAEAAYAALTAGQQALVEGAADLTAARSAYDAAAAAATDALIEAIGTVKFNPIDATKDSLAAIVAAEEAYAALTDAQKELVTGLDTLTAARATYENYIVLNDKACAADVDTLIAAIGEVNFNSRDAINAARAAYDALTETQQGYVTLYDTLVAAEELYEAYAPVLEIEAAIDAIGKLDIKGSVFYREFAGGQGYCELHNDASGNDDAARTFSFDFMYNNKWGETKKNANVGFMNSDGYYVGFDLTTNKAIVAAGGGWSNICEDQYVYAVDYTLAENTWYNITLGRDGATFYAAVDGVEVINYTLETATNFGTGADGSWYIFYPQYFNGYFTNGVIYNNGNANTTEFANTAAAMGWGYTVVDIASPVDFVAQVEAVEALVAALSDDQLALLSDEYKATLAAASEAVDNAMIALESEAYAVEVLIDAIASAEDAAAATAAFNALTPTAKGLVVNYADLQAANAGYVDAAITAIGEVGLYSNELITAAEAGYNALTDAEKALVVNAQVLTDARATYNRLWAEVNATIAAINDIYYGGNAVAYSYRNDGEGAYSQAANNPDTAHFEFGFAMTGPTAVNTDERDNERNHVGGSTSDSLFAGYDINRGAFIIANLGCFDGGSLISDDVILASYEMALDSNTWYFVNFVYGTDYIAIELDGAEILRVDNITRAGTWYIFYPHWSACYFDNFRYILNDQVLEYNTNTGNGCAQWMYGFGGAYNATIDAPIALICEELGLDAAIDNARALFDALNAEQQAAVGNYNLLTDAEAATTTPADEATDAIENIGDIADVTLDDQSILEKADDIAAALDAFNALTEEEQAEVENADALFDALAAYNKALVYDAVLNGSFETPAITVEGGEDVINVSWNAVADAVAYWVFVDDVVVLKTTDTSAVIPATVGDHIVKVQAAVKVDANVGAYGSIAGGISAEAACTVVAGYRFTAEGLINEDGNIAITWNAYDNATLYYVEITNNNTGVVTTIKVTDATANAYTTPDGSFQGTSYSVVVKAFAGDAVVSTVNVVDIAR